MAEVWSLHGGLPRAVEPPRDLPPSKRRMFVLTYDRHGHKRLDLPQLVGAYGSGIVSTYWSPRTFSPLVQGVQTGHLQFGFVGALHMVQEFSPEIKRMWPIRKVLNRNADKHD